MKFRCILFLLLCVSSIHSVETPKIEILETNANIGKQFAGAQVPITYTVTNRGTVPLTIIQVGASCGCLASQRSWPESLSPGQSGTIALIVDTSGLSGVVAQPLTVFSNDADTEKISLWIRGEVEQIFVIDPIRATFGFVAGNQKNDSKIVNIRNISKEPRILSLTTLGADSRFSATLAEIRNGFTWSLAITPRLPLAFGMNSEDILVKTDHPVLSALHVEASAWVPPPVQAIPPRIVIPHPAQKDVQRRVIMVRARTGQTWKVLSAICNDPRILVAPPVDDNAGSVRISLDIPANYTLIGDQSCEIRIQTVGPDGQAVQLQVPLLASK